MSDTALILIDIQNDYFPGGKVEVEGAEEAAANAAKVLHHFRRTRLPVFHVRHESVLPGRNFMLPGSHGAGIHPSVVPDADEAVIVKHYPNAFQGTDLLEKLEKQGVSHLVIAGMMTHMCIDTTVRSAFELGFRCTLLKDATATRALADGDETIPAVHVQRAFIAALGQLFATCTESQTLIRGM